MSKKIISQLTETIKIAIITEFCWYKASEPILTAAATLALVYFHLYTQALLQFTV